MYGFSSQGEGVQFLRNLCYDVGRGTHGMNHLFTAWAPGSKLDIAFVTVSGELCFIDEEKRPELGGEFQKIKDALKNYKP